MGGDSYLIDDRSVDYSALDEGVQIDRALRTLEAQYGLGPPSVGDDGGDDGSGWDPGDGGGSGGPLITYPPGSLWLALAMTNDPSYGNMAAITVNGTTNDTWYEILAKNSLTDPQWWSEGSLQGGAGQAVSQTSVTADSNTNSLFLWACTLTNGSGGTLPIWWQLQYFGRTGLDPNTDPSGQGTNLLASYSSKTNPPAIQLDWPQDGAQIGAGSFTLHGLTSDPTATVRAQVPGTNGILHTFFGVVERTGKFWIDNIPLAGGTNLVALTLTDSAGNSSSTNISVDPERSAADDESGDARLPVVAADGQCERDDFRPNLRGMG